MCGKDVKSCIERTCENVKNSICHRLAELPRSKKKAIRTTSDLVSIFVTKASAQPISSDIPQRVKKKCEKCSVKGRVLETKAISMGLRQIALLLLFFVFYVIIGGMIFMTVEAPREEDSRRNLKKDFAKFKRDLASLELPEETQSNISFIFETYVKAQDANYLADGGENLTKKWSFLNSFFFAITVVTTIGYGHLSPSSPTGKIFCLIYAVFGIPMTGILLGAIGDRFSRCFFDKVHKLRRRTNKARINKLIVIKQALIYLFPWFVVFLVLPSVIFVYTEGWSPLEGFYYSFITLSTIGFGDYVAAQNEGSFYRFYKIIIVLWIIFGLAYLSMILNFISQGFRSHHLSNVVHSLRKMPVSQSIHSRLKNHGLKHQKNKRGIKRQQSFPTALPNGNLLSVSGTSTPETLTPTTLTPSPNTLSSDNSSFPFDNLDGSVKKEKTRSCSIFKSLNCRSKKKSKTSPKEGLQAKRCSSLPDMHLFKSRLEMGSPKKVRLTNPPTITIIVDGSSSGMLSQASSISLSPSYLQNSPSFSLRSCDQPEPPHHLFFESLDDSLQVSYV